MATTGDAPPLSTVCSDLCDACCAETADGDGTGFDNVTAVIVELNTPGAAALTGRRSETGAGREGVPTPGGALSGSSEGEGEGSGDMDTSDDGKRKKEGGDGSQGGGKGRRSGKQMRAEASAVGAGVGDGGNDLSLP